MRGRKRGRIGLGLILASLGAEQVRADVLINLIVRDLNNNSVEVIEAGDEVFVYIRLSVTEDDNPTQDVRLLQFDLRAIDPQLEIVTFDWRLRGAGLFNEDRYERTAGLTEVPRATYLPDERDPGYIVDLDDDLRVVARLHLIAHRSGTVNVTSTELADPEDTSQGCWFVAGFDALETFTPHDGTVQGGELFIEVEGDDGFNENDNGGGSGGNENRNDNGGNDNGSANENKNDSGDNENKNDGSGNDNGGNDNTSNDNVVDGPRNEGPPAVGGFPCGAGAVGPLLFLLLALAAQRRLREGRSLRR
ncbi:MAG: hypothetical protein KJ057_07020 [Phycisphaerae bacterium]|nr:MAG: hypothetical protein F9K17_13310 [Phycisphaerae bacterium]MBE7456623.1 hypothetical protein [Planctomycetia bacterium]MCQ3920652.1 hypothetical protein [Planctomycetota bacterium]MCK6463997.1 hypothetical protein [Phycisphaerae bacterium]MCL4718212.1 hypothetical protein [Phycisphaerae bacterium]